MIEELFSHKDYVRVLHAVKRKPKRFAELQRALGLNPAQVDRAVKFLRKGFWIIPRVIPSEKGRLLIEYELGKKGAAFLESFDAFKESALRHRAALGQTVAGELQSFTR
jgi:DNA-binding HxlR family transcriptional regulator